MRTSAKFKLILGGLGTISLVSLATFPLMAKNEIFDQPMVPQVIAQVTPLPLNHFLCYFTQGTSVNALVRLRDQFLPGFLGATVTTPFRFCNPVEKRHNGVVTPIQNPNAHLELFRLNPTIAPTRSVRVRNQFGIQTLTVSNPILLGVPTRKLPHPTPTGLDHFKCYRATGTAINVKVDLKDQFQTQPSALVGLPNIFCNPVVKIHNGVTTPILHREAHLTCYRINRKLFSTTRTVINQFGRAILPMKDADTLCVPSLKLSFQVIS